MSEFIGLTKKELQEIQEDLKSSLNQQVQQLIKEIQEQTIGEGVDIVSMMAGKDSIALHSAIEFAQKAIEANNRKIADIINTRDTLVLQTSIDFAQRAIEANNKKIFEYIENKFKGQSGN